MTLLLNTSIKVTLIVFVALATTAVLRRRSAAVRHFVLAAALACAAATPALRLVAPAWQASMGAWLTESRVQLIDRPLLVLDSTTLPPAAVPGAQSPSLPRPAILARWLGIIWAASDLFDAETARRIKQSLMYMSPQFDCRRMVNEYMTQLYEPAHAGFSVMRQGNFEPARERALWNARVAEVWDRVRIVETSPAPIKYAMSLIGKCTNTVRLPMVPATENAQAAVRQAMVHAGLIN
jgi:hypothetical protein